ncbi:MAG: hypothetical protein LBL98_03335 [Ruminococcus sp.]|jgi:hypothetical protein|nr:hypothetical protein [Ruminococcus sp.]
MIIEYEDDRLTRPDFIRNMPREQLKADLKAYEEEMRLKKIALKNPKPANA